MWTFLQTRNARTLLSGVAAALTSGLMLGATLQPDLQGDGLLAPQTLIAGGGPRNDEASAADPGLARYAGRIPDYVIGTDWTRLPPVLAETPLVAETPSPAPVEASVYTSRDQLPELQATRAAWRDAPTEAVVYPSSSGGVVYETDLPPPPALPEDERD